MALIIVVLQLYQVMMVTWHDSGCVMVMSQLCDIVAVMLWLCDVMVVAAVM
jgi:hypothetical protein